MHKADLRDGWSLREAPLEYTKDMAGYVSAQADGWFHGLSLPCDVRMPLVDAGVIRDPVLADCSFDSEWVE